MKSVILAAVISLASAIVPGVATAKDVCGYSYIVLPDGRCLTLNYMTVLGESRSNQAEVDNLYQEQFDANLALEMNTRYRLTETKGERDARIKELAKTKRVRDDVASDAQHIEDTLYPLHHQAMRIVNHVLTPRQ